MGHFSFTCNLTGLPITGGTNVALYLLVLNKWYENDDLGVHGVPYLVSNEGTTFKFKPYCFPIRGKYNDYGSLEEIIRDDNVIALEQQFNLTIEQIIKIVTTNKEYIERHNKDLGFLFKNIEKQKIKGMKKDETHYSYYQRIMDDPWPFENDQCFTSDLAEITLLTYSDKEFYDSSSDKTKEKVSLIIEHYNRYLLWCEDNPDPEREYIKAYKFKDEYRDLISLSAMWIHGDVYDKVTNERTNTWYDKLDLGTPGLLEALGFVEIEEKSEDERFNRQFIKDGLTICSDGTFTNLDCVYNLEELKKYCEKKKVTIEIDEIVKKDRIEQMYDYVIPKYETLIKTDRFKEIGIQHKEMDGMQQSIAHFLLNTASYYGKDELSNPMTMRYFEMTKEGKLRDNIVRHQRFDTIMFANGRHYDINGSAPQDGEQDLVKRTLDVATEIINKYYE